MLTEIDFLQMPLIAKLKWLRDNTTIEKLTYFYANSTEVVACDVIDLKGLIKLFDMFSIKGVFVMDYNPDVDDQPIVDMMTTLRVVSSIANGGTPLERVFYHIASTWKKFDSSENRLEESIAAALMAHNELET